MRLTLEERSYIHRKVRMKVGKFSPSIERVTVRVRDANGPPGGVDKVCTAKVVVSGLPSLVVERKDQDIRAAIDGTVDAAARAVRNIVRRRRDVPRRASARDVGAATRTGCKDPAKT